MFARRVTQWPKIQPLDPNSDQKSRTRYIHIHISINMLFFYIYFLDYSVYIDIYIYIINIYNIYIYILHWWDLSWFFFFFLDPLETLIADLQKWFCRGWVHWGWHRLCTKLVYWRMARPPRKCHEKKQHKNRPKRWNEIWSYTGLDLVAEFVWDVRDFYGWFHPERTKGRISQLTNDLLKQLCFFFYCSSATCSVVIVVITLTSRFACLLCRFSSSPAKRDRSNGALHRTRAKVPHGDGRGWNRGH